MTDLAERAKGTAFEILYRDKPVEPTAAEVTRERNRLASERNNARRRERKQAEYDTKQKANWTI